MVAAAAYSAARARKPGGGAGSSMRSSDEAGGGQGVDVAGQRPVDERDEHALLDLLDRLVLDQVGPDAPVLLGRVEHLVVDPAWVKAQVSKLILSGDSMSPHRNAKCSDGQREPPRRLKANISRH